MSGYNCCVNACYSLNRSNCNDVYNLKVTFSQKRFLWDCLADLLLAFVFVNVDGVTLKQHGAQITTNVKRLPDIVLCTNSGTIYQATQILCSNSFSLNL